MNEPVYQWNETLAAYPAVVEIPVSKRFRRDAVVRLSHEEAATLRDMLNDVLNDA